ncbi:MAG: diguanylate cyclase [Geminicoccaceae bacterium]|nr:diguanylate cyclase [Geminicoccaceae bacterium]
MAESPSDPFSVANRPIVQALLLRSATRDLETGCLKDVYFAERASEEIARRRRYGGRLSLLLVAADGPNGETDARPETVVRLAGLLKSRIRSTDLLGRWETGELLVLLPNTGLSGAARLARRMLLGGSLATEPEASVSMSIGIATWLGDESLGTLVERARAGLREARARGGGCCAVA